MVAPAPPARIVAAFVPAGVVVVRISIVRLPKMRSQQLHASTMATVGAMDPCELKKLSLASLQHCCFVEHVRSSASAPVSLATMVGGKYVVVVLQLSLNCSLASLRQCCFGENPFASVRK